MGSALTAGPPAPSAGALLSPASLEETTRMTRKTIEATSRRPKTTGRSSGAAVASAGKTSNAAEAPEAKTAEDRACPTRTDGAAPLFQHRLTTAQCQSKQRGMYHKCFSCAHSNTHR